MSCCDWLVQVNWDYMDKELLEKFWQSSDLRQEIRKNLPDCMAVSCGPHAFWAPNTAAGLIEQDTVVTLHIVFTHGKHQLEMVPAFARLS